MIIDALLDAFKGVAMWVVGLLPAGSAVQAPDFGVYFAYANTYVNMPLLLTVAGFWIAYESSILLARILLWIWGVIKP